MSMISRQAMTVFMLAVFAIMVGTAITYPEGARFMPLTIGIPGILLCLLQIGIDFRRPLVVKAEKDEMQEAQEKAAKLVGHSVEFGHAEVIDAPHDEKEMVRREVLTWVYFLGFIGGVLLFGFYAAIPVFLVAFLRERAHATWKRTLTLSGIASVAFYLIFAKGLGVVLYPGALTSLVMDRIAG
ncbi:MAG: Tripartite tricarboxylate transporter TctB family protein [Hyphomicrobiales bacterium]|nr:Tripartite tricarboxylate transporter TctB family protein [Hyphomicrobiales bacterium]